MDMSFLIKERFYLWSVFFNTMTSDFFQYKSTKTPVIFWLLIVYKFCLKNVIVFIFDKCVMFHCVYTLCHDLHVHVLDYVSSWPSFIHLLVCIYHVNNFNYEQLISICLW